MKNLKQAFNLVTNITGLSGVLAGGSVRDTLMGREPKDYDFLVYSEEPIDMEVIENTLVFWGCEITNNLGSSWKQEPPQDGNDFLNRFYGGVSFKY